MSKYLKQDILYYRYVFVVTGLMFFALSYILSKSNFKLTILILITILSLGITNNISMIKENYSKDNRKPINYIKQNIKEGDVLTFPNIGSGSVIAINFPEYKQYYYNKAHWGIEDAYKAFGPQMEIWFETDFVKKCKGRTWIITSRGNFFL